MLVTIEELRSRVENDRPVLIAELQALTGRYGTEEARAWGQFSRHAEHDFSRSIISAAAPLLQWQGPPCSRVSVACFGFVVRRRFARRPRSETHCRDPGAKGLDHAGRPTRTVRRLD